MTLETNRLRTIVLALAMLLTAALLIETAQPAGADAAAKTKSKKKQKKRVKPKGPKRGPAGLKFYKPPKRLPAAHGKLIWQRPASRYVSLKGASTTRLVLYTSKSMANKSVPVSGLVSFPKGKAPRGGWPLVTFAHSTTGIADKCAPSRDSANGVVADGVSYINPVLEGWLKAGYAVARTDFQGLGTPGVHPYLVGKAAGRDVLDIARAARQLGPKIKKSYLIAGHSQGGHAALFAAGLAAKWTPEQKLAGTISYAPGSHLTTMAQFLPTFTTPNSLSGIAAMLLRGVSSVYPSLVPQQLLNQPGLDLFPKTLSECLGRLSEPDLYGGIAPADLLRDDADLPELYRVLDEQNPAVKTQAPILLLQGTADTSSFKILTDQLDGELDALGDQVDYKTYQDIDHWDLVDVAQPDALAFMQQRLPSGR
ncbi:MAG: alpha/beta fold hydrolase [Solirubrobacterales bacterium]|nr:alpha/beta fold hydrolase [Solirubrobacterales bacterium]